MAIAKAKWFDYELYMKNKLDQMKESDSTYTMENLVSAFNNAGFKGEEGAYNHFQKYGHKEDVSPNSLFDADYYYQSKALQYYQLAENGGLSTDQIKANMDLYAANMKTAINKAGMDAWTHYIKYGTAENVNPSADFNTQAYMEAKYAAWSATSAGQGKSMDDMLKAFKDANLNAVEHAVQYGTDPTTATAGEAQCWTDTSHSTLADEFASNDDPIDPADGDTFTLTTGIDNLLGTSGNDTFNAPLSGNQATLTGLDTVDGGEGTDTMNAVFNNNVTSLPGSISNIENLNMATNGFYNNVDLTKVSGLEKVSLQSQSNGENANAVTVADDVDVTVELSAGGATVNGGKNVEVSSGTVATPMNVTGKAIESVSIKGGAAAAINNTDDGGAAGKGTTLKSVVLDGIAGAGTIQGAAIEEITVKNETAAYAYTLTNATKDSALTLNLDGAGYNSATKAYANQTFDISTSAKVKDLTITTANNNQAVITGAALLKTISGKGSGTLNLEVQGNTALTSVDMSASEANITLTDTAGTAAALTTVKTGSGNDVFEAKQALKMDIETGAGDDQVTVSAALVKGSVIDLGAGNDALLAGAAGSIATDSSTVSKVDGGAGDDTLALSLVSNVNAGIFINFEYFDVAGLNVDFGMETMGSNTVKGLIATDALAANHTISGLTSDITLDIQADMGAKVLTMTQATAGTVNIKSSFEQTAADTAADAIAASLVATNATALTVDFESKWSEESQNVNDNLTNITLTGTKATALSITSGGENVGHNTAVYTSAANAANTADLLTTLSFAGDADLTFTYAPVIASSLSAVTSTMTGGLTTSLDILKAGGKLTLASGGDDVLTVQTGEAVADAVAHVRSVSGFEKGSAAGLTTQDGFDVLNLAGATIADGAQTSGNTVTNGIYTVTGTGYHSLAEMVTAMAGDLEANGCAAFQYTSGGNYYVYFEGANDGGTDDVLVELGGVTSLNGIDDVASGQIYAY